MLVDWLSTQPNNELSANNSQNIIVKKETEFNIGVNKTLIVDSKSLLNSNRVMTSDGSRLVVASNNYDGIINIYNRVNEDWILEAKLEINLKHKGCWSVDISNDGNVLVIAPYNFSSGDADDASLTSNHNSICIYTRNSNNEWLLTSSLVPDFYNEERYNYVNVSLSGDGKSFAIMYKNPTINMEKGSSYLYVYKSNNNEWIEDLKYVNYEYKEFSNKILMSDNGSIIYAYLNPKALEDINSYNFISLFSKDSKGEWCVKEYSLFSKEHLNDSSDGSDDTQVCTGVIFRNMDISSDGRTLLLHNVIVSRDNSTVDMMYIYKNTDGINLQLHSYIYLDNGEKNNWTTSYLTGDGAFIVLSTTVDDEDQYLYVFNNIGNIWENYLTINKDDILPDGTIFEGLSLSHSGGIICMTTMDRFGKANIVTLSDMKSKIKYL